jgi:hypothetical protein
VRSDHPTLRKEREGWERIPREEQMLLPAVPAWGTRRLEEGTGPKSAFLCPPFTCPQQAS